MLPGLYVGNYRDSKDAVQLDRYHISHIVAIHDSARKLHPVSINSSFNIQAVKLKWGETTCRYSKDTVQFDRYDISHIVAIQDSAHKLHPVSMNSSVSTGRQSLARDSCPGGL